MTQTVRRQVNRDARYRGVIYGIDLLDHDTRQVMPNDYVGKTRQRGRARENQHRDDKPWSDLIVGSSHVLWEGDCTEAELDEMERRFIQDVPVERRPRMNWLLNEDNPRQIPKAVQLEQRHQRDDAKGQRRWVPLEQRSASSLLEWSSTDLPAARRNTPAARKWKPWQIKAGLWSSAWVLLAVATWGGQHQFGLTGTWTQNALSCSGISTVLLTWSLWRKPDTWPMWRRRFRKWRRWLR